MIKESTKKNTKKVTIQSTYLHEMYKIIKKSVFALVLVLSTIYSNADHGTAAVSDIDYVGMGTFSGSYTHSGSDHVWVVFNATSGNTVTFTITTSFEQHYFLYKANNDTVAVGNSTSDNLTSIQDDGNGAFSATYTFNVTTSGQYALQLDAYIGQSGTYSIVISGATSSPAVIVSSPSDTALCAGGTATFGVLASNANSFYWQLNTGSGWSDISNSNDDTIKISNVNYTYNGNTYRCIARNIGGNDTSNIATLLVTDPRVLSSIGDTACIPNNASLSVVAADGGAQWYDALTGGNLIGTGNVLNLTSPSASANYYVQVAISSNDTINTGFPGGNGSNGFMMDILPTKNMKITSVEVSDFHNSTGTANIYVYYKLGTHVGSETTASNWIPLDTIFGINYSTQIHATLKRDLNLSANTLYAIYVSTASGTIKYSNGSTVGAVWAANDDITLYEGKGVAFPFAGTFSPRKGNIILEYEIGGGLSCVSSDRDSVRLTVFNSPVVNSVTSSNNPSSLGCKNCTELTASATGAGAISYVWNTSATGAVVSVCPTVTSNYTVTVTDTNGCSTTSSNFTQNVIDARHPQAGRVYMCQYQTSRRRWYTISPYTTQITQMLAAGSKCGACNYLPKRNGDISFEGIEEIYSIFPNPAQNQITVESYNLNSEEVTLELVDMTGRVVLNVFNGFVMQGEFTQVTADISTLPAGMYFMRYSSASDLRVNKVQVVR